MPTETDLRDALRARADSADERLDAAVAELEAILAGRQMAPREPRHRVAAGLAMAATVAAVAAVAALTGLNPGPHRTVRPASSTPPTAHSRTPGLPSQVTAPAVVNLVRIGIDRPVDRDLRNDAEYLTVTLSPTAHPQIVAFAPSIGFGPARIAGATPVTVAGRRGVYGRVSVWPANGRPDPVTHKQNGAIASVAWRLDDSTWVVVQGDDPFAPATTLVALANSLGVAAAPQPVRLPFTLGGLPGTFRLTRVHLAGTGAQVDSADVDLTSSSGDLTISLGEPLPSSTLVPGASASRTAQGETLIVRSQRFDQSVVQSVLDGLTVVGDPTSESGSWPTLAQALR